MSPEPVDLHEPHIFEPDTVRRPRGRWAFRPRAVPRSTTTHEVETDWDPDALFQWATSHGATQPDRSGPWAVLGLTPDATWLEVLRRHRELTRRHHPELLADASAAEQAASRHRMELVDAAFDELNRRYHGDRRSL